MRVYEKGALLFAVAMVLLVAAAGPVAAATRTPTAIRGVKSEYTAAKLTVTGKLVRKSGARWVALPGKHVVFSKYEDSKLVRIGRLKTNAAGKFTVQVEGGIRYQLAFKADARYASSAAKVTVAGPATPGSCADCHTSMDALTASASQGVDPAKELVKNDFVASQHDANGCWACHKGDPLAPGKAAAHDGMVADPVADGGTAACGQCHSDDVATHKTSLHYTTNGLKDSFFGRLKNCPGQAEQSWRSKACVDCHASCGTCHVARPRDPWVQSGPKGLLDGHDFLSYAGTVGEKKADTTLTCYVCHAGSITDPEAGFQKNDVHNTPQISCVTCHDKRATHGDGTEYQTMIGTGAAHAECKECHPPSSLTGREHSFTHQNLASCQSCHSLPYRNCYDCHGWQRIIDGATYPFIVKYDIKLGFTEGKITTLVKGPVSKTMLADEGIPEITGDLNTQSSWYAGFPHNVTKPTPNQALCDRCHGSGTALLKQSDLQFPEYEEELLVPSLTPVVAPLP
jgi:hypothetical protein